MSSNMNDDAAIRVDGLGKCYQIYETPRDRLKQMVLPRLRGLLGLKKKSYFKEFWAIQSVSFEVKRGESVGIIGRNGSGKSTLLQIICGTLNPTQGSVHTRGRIAALLELGSGFNPEFTGRENVFLNASVLGLSQSEIASRYEQIVSFADIGSFVDQPVKTYSSGMMVRLAFAVIAHVDADILVIDEALAVGDAVFTQKCMRFLRNFMETGTVLFVTHDTNAVTSFCQHAVLLARGAVVTSGPAKPVVEKYLELNYLETQKVELGVLERDRVQTPVPGAAARGEYRDMRADFINSTSLRNDVKVFAFDERAADFGAGGAELGHVLVLDAEGRSLVYVVGGEDVVLEIAFKAKQSIERPIIGFTFKDRLGQAIFVDNTYVAMRDRQVRVGAGQIVVARFEFRFPVLPPGEYSLSPAIADGTQEEHVQLQWVHDALILQVESSPVWLGLIGLPMRNISLAVASPG
jgi:lipopolysaccharide transport system ATP-binding protein